VTSEEFAPIAGAAHGISPVTHISSFRVVKADLLQLWHRGGGAGDEHHSRDQVIGQFGRERAMRQLVGVHVRLDRAWMDTDAAAGQALDE